MKTSEVIYNLKRNIIPNITNLKQMKVDELVYVINEALVELHNKFMINTEQAIIIVPAFRHSFKLDVNDDAVILETYKKIAKYELEKGAMTNQSEVIEALKKMNKTNELKPLKIIGVEDNVNTEYLLNQERVFAITQDTLYFPECFEGQVIYVSYKPQPIVVTMDNLESEVDLPDTLLESLYAFIHLRILQGVEGANEKFPNLFNSYNEKIKQAILDQAVVPDSLATNKLTRKKGFY